MSLRPHLSLSCTHKASTQSTSEPDEDASEEQQEVGVFRGKSMILPDEIATQILDILREKGNKLSWLSNIKFGKHKLEKHKINICRKDLRILTLKLNIVNFEN